MSMSQQLHHGFNVNPFSLMRAGRNATTTVPRLKTVVFQGFMMNLAIYIVIVAALNLLFHGLIMTPARDWWQATSSDYTRGMGMMALLLVQVAVMAVSSFFSIRISLKFMGLWYERMARYVVNHFDPRPESTSNLKKGMLWAGATLGGAVKEMGIAVALMFVGFVPVIGAVTVLLIGSYLMGQSIADPYNTVIKDRDPQNATRVRKRTKMFLGWGLMVLSMIPVIGWLLLPVATLYQVVGFAWLQAAERFSSGRDLGSAQL